MAVKIRFARVGKKNAPMFRIVAIDSQRKRDGQSLEILGAYNPRSGEIVQFHADRIEHWVNNGAVLSDAVKRLQKNYRRTAGSKEVEANSTTNA